MKQDPEARFVVLYNAAGKNISAAMISHDARLLPFFAEHKIYASAVQARVEGEYLVSVLNSAFVNESIKPFQTLGLLGERDIEKKVLELPIPRFDRKDPIHARLAALGDTASDVVESSLKVGGISGTLATRRRLARDAAAAQLKEIDELVRKLLAPSKKI